MKKARVAVLLLGFGAPDALSEVEPFLKRVFSSQGKIVPPPVFNKILEETLERYKAIGGRSPYLDITRLQAQALEGKLNEDGADFKVYVGMRNSHPSIKQTLKLILSDEAQKRIVVLSLSPQFNKATTGSNIRELKNTLSQTGTNQNTIFVNSWCDNSAYLDALSDKVREGLGQISKAKQDQIMVLFSAHSLPKRLVEQGDPYLKELEETIAGVVERLGQIKWQLCFQSRGRDGEWLGPDIKNVVSRLGKRGCREVLVVPISFIADNIEILYDIDISLREEAKRVGIINFGRINSLNDSPKFIEALAQIVLEHTSKID